MNYRRVLAVAIVFSLIAYAFLHSQTQPKIKNLDSSGNTIVAFGDSLVFGHGASIPGGTDMFSLVSKELKVPIINKGVTGDTTQNGLDRLEQDVLSQDAKIVFVLLGGNDYLRKVDKEVTFQNLSKIIEKIQAQGAVVILIGVRGGIFKDRFEDDYKMLTDRYKTAYVPNILEGLVLNTKFMFDAVHPNDRGYKIAAQRILPVLKAVLDDMDNSQ